MDFMPVNNTVYLFTDGASSLRGEHAGNGGWGCVLLFNDKKKELMGGSPRATNNSMELTAIQRGLLALTRKDLHTVIYTDSKYCIDCLTSYVKKWKRRGWKTAKGNPVKNKTLISDTYDLLGDFKNVEFIWVKGHSGVELNERADYLAVQGKYLVNSLGEHNREASGGLVVDPYRKRRMIDDG